MRASKLIQDELVDAKNPNFILKDLGKLGAALKKHFEEFPDLMRPDTSVELTDGVDATEKRIHLIYSAPAPAGAAASVFNSSNRSDL